MGDGQIRWKNACGAQLELVAPKLCKAGRRQRAGQAQAKCSCSRTCSPLPTWKSWKGPGKEATARLIPPLPFAEAAEEVGHTGRSARVACWALLDGESRQASCVRAGVPAWLGTILEWAHNRMHCYDDHSLLPKCGWQRRPLRPLSSHQFSPLIDLVSGPGRPHRVKCSMVSVHPWCARGPHALVPLLGSCRPKSSIMDMSRSLVVAGISKRGAGQHTGSLPRAQRRARCQSAVTPHGGSTRPAK